MNESDPVLVKQWIKKTLSRSNIVADVFVERLNTTAEQSVIDRELQQFDAEDKKLIYGKDVQYVWNVAIRARKLELKKKVENPNSRNGFTWETVFNVILSRD
jgi:hypothetical protein